MAIENLSAKQQLGYGADRELSSWLDEAWGPLEQPEESKLASYTPDSFKISPHSAPSKAFAPETEPDPFRATPAPTRAIPRATPAPTRATPAPTRAIPRAAPSKGLSIHTKGRYNTYTKKRGTKATRNNNPGNITGMGGKLLYGAKGFARSSTGDKGDQNQLVYGTAEEGFKAMHTLAMSKYSRGPIRQQFKRWQTDMKSFNRKLKDLSKYGVNINKSYASLDPQDQKLFRKIWSQHEGYRGTFY